MLKKRLLWRQFFFHFRSVSKSLSAFVDFRSTGLLKLRATCPWDLFGRKFSFLRKLFSFFFNVRTLGEELHVFRRGVFSRFFKTSILHSKCTQKSFVNFSKKKCLKTSWGQWKENCSLARIFSRIVKTAF